MDCGVCPEAGDLWLRLGSGGGGAMGQIGGGFSHESEHDLAMMVSDFLENGSGGADSRCSSDSDSGFCDIARLADKISYYRHSMDKYERDLQSVVYSHILSINKMDLPLVKSGSCNTSCIRFSLVKLLRLSGYDAAVCASKWQGIGKVPGGDHEYIDVVNYNFPEGSERVIIDIDFQSHFEIARAVASYDRLLNILPVVYVGSFTKLKQFLQVMVEAAKSSLKQNSMPLPPWRSLAYLQAKWQSPYQRHCNPDKQKSEGAILCKHKQCSGHLKRLLQSSFQFEIEVECLLKPLNNDGKRRLNFEKRRHSTLKTLKCTGSSTMGDETHFVGLN